MTAFAMPVGPWLLASQAEQYPLWIACNLRGTWYTLRDVREPFSSSRRALEERIAEVWSC